MTRSMEATLVCNREWENVSGSTKGKTYINLTLMLMAKRKSIQSKVLYLHVQDVIPRPKRILKNDSNKLFNQSVSPRSENIEVKM